MPAEANDIFISYAWADNEPPSGATAPEDRWVWQFERALSAALRSKLGTPSQVWIDRRAMRINDLVPAVLTEELQRSRLLLVLMSPSWRSSTWCRQELETFLEQHRGTPTQEGVFVVEIEPVAREKWHERIRALGAFQFYKPLSKGTGTVRLGHPLPNPLQDRDFYNDIVAVAHDIATALEARQTPAPAADTAQAPDLRPPEEVVWIAEPTDDLSRRRRELQDAVRQAGYEVVTPSLDSMRIATASIERQLEQGMEAAGLFVQLLGPHTGRTADDGRSWTQVQHALAHRTAARRGLPFIAWRDVGTMSGPVDDPQRVLLTGAVEQGFEELRSDVLRRLAAPRTAPVVQPSRTRGDSPLICITCSEEDEQISQEVTRMLNDLQVGWMRFIDGRTDAPMEPDPAEEKVLGDSTGVVIVYGAADTSWFVTKVQRTNQLRRRPQTLWGAVVDAPVPGKRPAPSAQSIERHDWAKGPDFESMRRFVQTVGATAHV